MMVQYLLIFTFALHLTTTRGYHSSSFPRQHLHRRVFISTLSTLTTISFSSLPSYAAIDVSSLSVEGTPVVVVDSSRSTINLSGVTYTPAAMILQLAEQTSSMEGMMKVSAEEVSTLSKLERIGRGVKGQGLGVIDRSDLTRSVSALVENSKLPTIAPAAALRLREIPRILASSKGDMTSDEYTAVAAEYARARDDLKGAFDKLPEDEKEEGLKIVRILRNKDAEKEVLGGGRRRD
jgi:hypothetical protein